jgi:hypothetical protein
VVHGHERQRESGPAQRTNHPPAPGTYTGDQFPGVVEYGQWGIAHAPFSLPPIPVSPGKLPYSWYGWTDHVIGFDRYKLIIDNGQVPKVDFRHWNIHPRVPPQSILDPGSGETIDIYEWGSEHSQSFPPDPLERWNLYTGPEGIGHAVSGVGYILNLNGQRYAIVHDNWVTTPRNVAVPWQDNANWNATIYLRPWCLPCVVDSLAYYDSVFQNAAAQNFLTIGDPATGGNEAENHGEGYWDDIVVCGSYSASAVPEVPTAGRGNVTLSLSPNPVRGLSSLGFALPQATADARISVYQPSGRLVATLYRGIIGLERQTMTWDGRGPDGPRLPSGAYEVVLEAKDLKESRSLILLK